MLSTKLAVTWKLLRGCCIGLMITIVGDKHACFRRARAKWLCYRSCWSQLTLPWQNAAYVLLDVSCFEALWPLRLFTCSQLVPHLIRESAPRTVVLRLRRSSIGNLLRGARNSLRDDMNLRWMLAKSACNR